MRVFASSQDVGDHSAFVGDISERLPKQFEPIARHLSKIHYRFFCDKFVQSFVARFVTEVHKCRKISEKGAQQLLLDTALIKTTLLEAPVIAGQGRQMPTAYSNYVLSPGRSSVLYDNPLLASQVPIAGRAAWIATTPTTPTTPSSTRKSRTARPPRPGDDRDDRQETPGEPRTPDHLETKTPP